MLVLGATFTGKAGDELLAGVAEQDMGVVHSVMDSLVARRLARSAPLHGVPRLELHPLAYKFARRTLEEMGGLGIAETRVAQECVAYAERHRGDADRMEAELGNLLGAAGWAAHHRRYEIVRRLAAILPVDGEVLSERHYVKEAFWLLGLDARVARAMERAGGAEETSPAPESHEPDTWETRPSATPEAPSVAPETEGVQPDPAALMEAGRISEALAAYRSMLDAARARGDKDAMCEALAGIALALDISGDRRQAEAHYRQALSLAYLLGKLEVQADVLYRLGVLLMDDIAHIAEAVSLLEEALALRREMRDARAGETARKLRRARSRLEHASKAGEPILPAPTPQERRQAAGSVEL